MTEEHSTGANHIGETIHRFLDLKLKREHVARHLFIQLDNCSRENKNRYLLSYIEYLVSRKRFECIEVSFLPVGHTHEDVDQVFSCTSERLRSHDAITLSDLEPSLNQTPPTVISTPPGKIEVTKRLDSEESRIGSTKKLRELHALRDEIFSKRTLPFHWDLTDCFEMITATHPGRTTECEEDEELDPNMVAVPFVLNGLTGSDYNYAINSYVAARTEDKDDGAHFWIGKVVELKNNAQGVICQLLLHWLQLEKGSDIYDGKYALSYLDANRRPGMTPWKSYVPADSVMENFSHLTRRGQLPVMVQKHLREAECPAL